MWTSATRLAWRILLLLVLVTSGSAEAQNLLSDSGFDDVSQLSSWIVTPSIVELTWNPDDAGGNIASGSGEITNSSASQLIGDIYQCAPVLAGESYKLGGWFYILSEKTPAWAWMTAFFFDSSDCGPGSILDWPPTDIVTTLDQWVFIETEVTAPEGARSAWITASNWATEQDGQSVVLVDNVFFSILPSVPIIFVDGFESGDLTVWSSTVGETP